MIRLPSSNAAITAPLVASITDFPGIPIGRSLLDGRPFHLSPVLTEERLLPSTNSLGMGGLGSGKSTTGKARIRREILHHGHQAVVIDSFGEDGAGEWASLTRSLGGRVIDASSFTLNPCSGLFPREVREELIRSLIAAVEPGALTPQSTHAVQHALNHPKATSLGGLVDALVRPEDGRWPAAKLAAWGEAAAIALSRYTEGSLRGLFDSQDTDLPETDLPILSFDFSRLDRNSPAIPSLMAAVSCWAEQVWLPQSTAVHRHLVLEEAWQILLSPATSELIQRLLKNSRKAGLSLDVLMHTLSDLGDGRAQDLAKLCEVAHVGRLGPEEAAHIGALLDLPAWAVDRIPHLDPGQAVWRVGPNYVDIIETVLSDDELTLTDTSTRRRRAQQALDVEAVEAEAEAEAEVEAEVEDVVEDEPVTAVMLTKGSEEPVLTDHDADEGEEGDWDWEMPVTVIDARHYDVVRAAEEGRCGEAAELVVVGEREDIRAYGINSDEAVEWLSTRARVAELCGSPYTAAQLRATVTRMGKEVNWWSTQPDASTSPAEHHGTQLPAPAPDPEDEQPARRRRTWPYLAAIAALAVAIAAVWQGAADDKQDQEQEQRAVAYQGRSGAAFDIDGVKADVVAHWTSKKDHVIVELRASFEPNAKYLRIDSSGKTAVSLRGDDRYPRTPEVELPVNDPLADVTVQIAIGGKTWKEGTQGTMRSVRLSPTGVAFDAKTGEKLPSDL
ncbi:hypothetical protein QZH56_36790 [Streptomyces olivoreticuli]|uniref:hypothetical protein n=1 Tax=Streptomyces olivoreticuli TaxID=68246 RepID=UPI00265A7AB2|nr:hypothetical protein [Streptomyces olivoreticuli]WKK24136.1 hypothetical protein QZH56_36790 [Streptomyces olivoreticuli]